MKKFVFEPEPWVEQATKMLGCVKASVDIGGRCATEDVAAVDVCSEHGSSRWPCPAAKRLSEVLPCVSVTVSVNEGTRVAEAILNTAMKAKHLGAPSPTVGALVGVAEGLLEQGVLVHSQMADYAKKVGYEF